MRKKDLRDMLEAVERCCGQLKTLGGGGGINQTSIILIIQEKLPHAVLVELKAPPPSPKRIVIIREEAQDIIQNAPVDVRQ